MALGIGLLFSKPIHMTIPTNIKGSYPRVRGIRSTLARHQKFERIEKLQEISDKIVLKFSEVKSPMIH